MIRIPMLILCPCLTPVIRIGRIPSGSIAFQILTPARTRRNQHQPLSSVLQVYFVHGWCLL